MAIWRTVVWTWYRPCTRWVGHRHGGQRGYIRGVPRVCTSPAGPRRGTGTLGTPPATSDWPHFPVKHAETDHYRTDLDGWYIGGLWINCTIPCRSVQKRGIILMDMDHTAVKCGILTVLRCFSSFLAVRYLVLWTSKVVYPKYAVLRCFTVNMTYFTSFCVTCRPTQ